MKTLHYSDAGFDCKDVTTAETTEVVLSLAAQHASDMHGVTITPQMTEQVIAPIKEE